MKSLIFSQGKVGPLPAYLGYLFLRFPGSLGPEEAWDLDGLDTYDRRWSRQGRVWVRRGEATFLVEPPSFLALDQDAPTAFGLQKPQLLGRTTVRVRSLEFTNADQPPLRGQWVKIRTKAYLVLWGKDEDRWDPVVEALTVDGLEPLGAPIEPLFKDKGPGFTGLTSWPAPVPEDHGVPFLLARLKDGLRVARQYEKGIQDDVDTECLHQYRVHLRRVRSLASLGRMWQLIPEWNRLKMVLRTLQQKTNELRDLDVLLLDFPELQGKLPWDEGPRLAGWGAWLVKRRQAELRRVKLWLESEEFQFALGEVESLLVDLEALGEPWSVADLATSAFQKSARSLQKSLKALGPRPVDAALHEVRIQAKRMRYVLDGLGDLGPASTKLLVTTLKESQDGLGRFQDRSILLNRLQAELVALRSKRKGSDAPCDPWTFGILIGVLVADQEHQKSAALKDSKRLRSKPFLKALGRLVEPQENADGS